MDPLTFEDTNVVPLSELASVQQDDPLRESFSPFVLTRLVSVDDVPPAHVLAGLARQLPECAERVVSRWILLCASVMTDLWGWPPDLVKDVLCWVDRARELPERAERWGSLSATWQLTAHVGDINETFFDQRSPVDVDVLRVERCMQLVDHGGALKTAKWRAVVRELWGRNKSWWATLGSVVGDTRSTRITRRAWRPQWLVDARQNNGNVPNGRFGPVTTDATATPRGHRAYP